MKKRLVIGMTGASGAPLGIATLNMARKCFDIETHVIYTESFLRTLQLESNLSPEDINNLADKMYDCNDISAAIASGTFYTVGMVIVPCSMKTLAGIACGFSDNLLLRAADVTLKERRKLVLVTRESPLSQIHLKNMLTLSQMGAVILPPVLTYYNCPETIEDMTQHIVGKIYDSLCLEMPGFRRWEGPYSGS